jgi:flavin-dependent dehydrogenase
MKVAVIGFGPSGSTAAALLSKQGHDVAAFDEAERPNLLVGESLVPGVIPTLRALGIEHEVAQIGVRKPGVTFYTHQNLKLAFRFQSLPSKYPQYAYNVPRPAFDELLQQRAVHHGAGYYSTRLNLKADADYVRLPEEVLAMRPSWKGCQPDLIIDATGRRRLIARTLGIDAKIGPRKDVSHFAHFEGLDQESPDGQVAIHYLKAGWAWRIPLKTATSFGVVLPQQAAAQLGDSPETRLEQAIERDPILKSKTKNLRRISSVQTYGNYQLISQRGFGANWVSVGDAFGFVDPMLSPGMSVALQSAATLVEELNLSGHLSTALRCYENKTFTLLTAWMQLIDYFYSGQIFELHQVGKAMQAKHPKLPFHILENFMSGNIASMASGFCTSSVLRQKILSSTIRFLTESETSSKPYAVA